jgi:hypothetical protein
MKEQDLKELTSAFDAVFDDDAQIKACGRIACMNLITLMKKHSSQDVGDEKTGNINFETMKNEFLRILRTHIRG